MKVLEKGPGWSLKTKCTGFGNGNGGCGSVLLVEKDDIFITVSSNYADDDNDYYYTFCCPVCNQQTDIKEDDLPASVRELAWKKYKERITNRKMER